MKTILEDFAFAIAASFELMLGYYTNFIQKLLNILYIIKVKQVVCK